MANKMNIYLKTLIPTIFVFLIGIMIGIWVENYGLSEARKAISESEINWNDAQLFNSYLEKIGNSTCDLAFEQNLEFNNKIYQKGLEIEKVIKAEIFTPEVLQEWRRYVLLQTQFWFNSIELKNKCKFDYHNVVYLSKLVNLSTDEMVDSKTQSNALLELKYKCGKKMMLIPISTDLDLIVVDAIVKQYNITKSPAVIVDEKHVFQGLTQMHDIEKLIGC